MKHVLLLTLLLLFGSANNAQAETNEEKTSKSKVVKLLNLIKPSGSTPSVKYKPAPTGGSMGVDFVIPGTNLGGSTFYTRKTGAPEAWHIGLSMDAKDIEKIKPLTEAYQGLSDVIGNPQFESFALIISENDGAIQHKNLKGNLNGVLGDFISKSQAHLNKKVIDLKKGINVFAKIKPVNKGPFKAWEQIILAGGKVSKGSLKVQGTLGYDVLDKIYTSKKVKVDKKEAEADKKEEKKDPTPYSLSVTFPSVIGVPFSLMKASDAKKVFFQEIDSTKLLVSIDKATGKYSLSAAQKVNYWITDKLFTIDNTISIEEEKVGASKKVTIKGKGALDISKNPLKLGSDAFKLVGLDANASRIYMVSSSGKVEEESEEKKGLNSAGAAFGAQVNGNNKPPGDIYGIGLGATFEYSKDQKLRGSFGVQVQDKKLKEAFVSLEGELKVDKLDGLNTVPVLKNVTMSNLSFGLAPQGRGADVFLTGGASIGKVGGKLALIAKAGKLLVLYNGNQFSVLDVVDAFGDKRKILSKDHATLDSIVMPELIVAVGISTRKGSDSLDLSKLPTPVKKAMAGAIANSNSKLPISQDGVSIVGKIDYDKMDKSLKDALKTAGVELKGNLLVAGTIDGLTTAAPTVGLSIQLPNFAFTPNGKQDLSNVIRLKDSTANFFIKMRPAESTFQLGLQGNMVLLLPRSGFPNNPDQVSITGELYANVQATGAGVRFAGYLSGDWRAPMGFEGMNVKNGAILLGVDSEGAVEFGAGVKVAFDIPTQNREITKVIALKGKSADAFNKTQLASLNKYGEQTRSNEITTGFVLNLVVSSGVPIPKKVGFVYKASSMSLEDIVGINDILMRGVVTGELGNSIIALFKEGDPVKDILREVQRGAKDRSASKQFMERVQNSPIPWDELAFKNVELFFATPGAILSGFPDLNGQMGVAIAGDVYVSGKKVQVSNTTKKFEIRLTTAGLELGGLGELIENTYLDAASFTVEALAAELDCPKGAFWDAGKSSCWSCPTGFHRTLAAVDSDTACIKRTTTQKSAKFIQKANTIFNCPTGSFHDPINGGECWSCPSGYTRNAKAVTDAKACTQIKLAGTKRAIKHGKGKGLLGTDCGHGQFWDPNGNCYSCPRGTIRGVSHVDSDKACFALSSQLKEAKATLVRKGQPQAPTGYSQPFNDIGRAEFWACPIGFNRTIYPVNNGRACEEANVEFAKAKSEARGNLKNLANNACLSFDFPKGTTYLEIREGAKVEAKYTCSTERNRTQSWFMDSAKRLRPLQFLSFKEGQSKPLCIQASGKGAATKLSLEHCKPDNNQKWLFDKNKRIQNRDQNLCLNNQAQLVDCGSSKSLQWESGPKVVDHKQAPKLAESGHMTVASSLNDLCLMGTKSPKYAVSMEICLGNKSQVWKLTSKGELKTAENNCLAISGGKKEPGSAIQTHRCIPAGEENSSKWTHYQWYQGVNGQIKSRLNDLCLDVVNANKNPGAKLQTQKCTGHVAQKWITTSAPKTVKAIKPYQPPKAFYLKAARYKKARGLIGTDCPKGQFWDAIDGFCYSCPNTTNRSTHPINSDKACIGYGDKPSKITYAGGTPPKKPAVENYPWKQTNGAAKDISISSTGVVWVVAADGTMYYRDFAKNNWVVIEGKATQIAAGKAGNVFHMTSAGKMYRGGLSGWKNLPGTASHIAAGPNDEFWHLSKNKVGPGGHAIYRMVNNRWTKVPGEAIRIAVGAKGKVWAISENGDIYKSANNAKKWTKVPGKASEIAVAQTGRVWHLSKDAVGKGGHAAYYSDDDGASWQRISGEVTQIATAPNGQIWGVSKINKIYDGNPKRSHTPKISYKCPSGYDKNVTRPWTAPNACEKPVFSRATKHRKAGVCPSGQEKQLAGGWAGFCISCPSGYSRDILIDPAKKGACFKVNKQNAQYAKVGKHARWDSCPTGYKKDPNGSCYQCPSGYARTLAPVTASNACGAAFKKAVKAQFKGQYGSCPSGQFKHVFPGAPASWQGYCLSCPKGYTRTVEAANSSKACVKTVASSKATTAAKRHNKVSGVCSASQFQHLLGPASWNGHCVSCPSGYVRNANAVDGSKACDKLETKKPIISVN